MERKENNILNSVKEALGFSHYTPFISEAFLRANLKASIYMSLVIMTLESWMMIMVYQIYLNTRDTNPKHNFAWLVEKEKLYRLEAVVTRIFDQVEREPKSAPDLHKMMSYYLPITRKLVDAYRDLDRQTVEGQNITKTKQEIKASLDTINTAFENLLDSFFQDTAWDVSSDITVLKTMMAQDGLMEKDFTSGEKIKTVAEDVTGQTLTR